ncbi:MAG: hypothetical protein V4708_13505 [Bacteroidota bacterium]
MRETFGINPEVSRILPGTVPELSRKYYEASTDNSPSVPEGAGLAVGKIFGEGKTRTGY